MFSATFAGHVGRLAQNLLREPKRIDVASHTDTHENIEQRLHWADNVNHKNAIARPNLDDRSTWNRPLFSPAPSAMLTGSPIVWPKWVTGWRPCMAAIRKVSRNRVLQGLRNGHLRVLDCH